MDIQTDRRTVDKSNAYCPFPTVGDNNTPRLRILDDSELIELLEQQLQVKRSPTHCVYTVKA